jgi:hypothetical protein
MTPSRPDLAPDHSVRRVLVGVRDPIAAESEPAATPHRPVVGDPVGTHSAIRIPDHRDDEGPAILGDRDVGHARIEI